VSVDFEASHSSTNIARFARNDSGIHPRRDRRRCRAAGPHIKAPAFNSPIFEKAGDIYEIRRRLAL
jgi:hypothetical protein